MTVSASLHRVLYRVTQNTTEHGKRFTAVPMYLGGTSFFGRAKITCDHTAGSFLTFIWSVNLHVWHLHASLSPGYGYDGRPRQRLGKWENR